MTGVAQTLEVAPFIRASLGSTDDVIHICCPHSTYYTEGMLLEIGPACLMPVCTVATLRGWRAQVRSTCGVLGAATVGDEVRAAMDGAVPFGLNWHLRS